ncbi:hypothetical protein RHP75_19455 [Pseudomonas sp. SG20056]|uniref:NACHT domain-containing protein n=1 Tax=Pseudomonas sp. SG20056 TaxID=3074146 RepID=UPI00287FDB21|nr:hypothetical protein [Pseudomonas sp. SG20056]WNF46526.1 hypothetical protein RHP75_19455 [Pseudomonas sp. SG20056]
MLVARRVQKTAENQDEEREELPLSDFRHTPAWVLLGEPGAGKSQALKQEAQEVGGEYVTVSELVVTTPPLEEWHGKTLFIDALDEARAAGSESLILRIRQQLRQLGKPAFRLSCRAADWHSSTDTSELQSISPDNQLTVLQLCPLSDDDIQQILQHQYNVAEPKVFIEQAEQHGIAPLLSNPQMLGLMARAVSGGCWPESRSEVYRLACEKLAQESNALHRQASVANAVDSETLLKAAGQLFAVQLLSGTTGIATDLNASNTANPELDQFKPEIPAAARKALQSALFTPAPGQVERLAPCHRSVAEFLAAKWLADKLDRESLPHGRLLKLLLGFDGGVVADLRGLLAWLARYSTSIRTRLIDVDPLGIVLYGDVRQFSVTDKRHLLQALRQQAERFPGFRWNIWQDMTGFRALTDSALIEDFICILKAPERDEATQSHMDCVLDILEYGHPYTDMAAPLLAVIKDASFWPRLRYSALRAWLRMATPAESKALLSQICSGQVEDEDDELLSRLLDRLYPEFLIPDELLQCLHPPKDTHLIGGYRMFLEHGLSERAPADQLPALLDGLCTNKDYLDEDRTEGMISRSVDRLLVRTLTEFGELATDEQLLNWLGVGTNKHGYFNRDHDSRTQIQRWLEQRPEKYKAVLAQCIEANARGSKHASDLLLHDAAPPADIGLWHLHLAGIPEEATARIHAQYATHALMQQRGAEGLSLEALEAWARDFPERADWLNEGLVCDLERVSWRLKDAASTRAYRERQAEERRQRTQEITPELPAIAAGTASAHLLEHLVRVWLDHFSDIHGDTISARFASYSDLGDSLVRAAESGFRKCLHRPDLPSTTEVINLSQAGKRYYISLPCLLGLQLNWADAPEQVAALPDDQVELLLVIYLCTPHFGLDGLSDWCAQTAQQRPELFSRVLIHQATRAFAAGNTSAGMTHLLARDATYAKVAQLASPELLRQFPENATEQQLHDLRQLMRATLETAPERLAALALNKLNSPQLNTEQRPLWLALQLLTGTPENEDEFWQHLGKTDKANPAMQLVVEVMMQGIQLQTLQPFQPERIVGRLIETLTPHAELERHRGGGLAMDLGDELRGMIDWLGAQPTAEARDELQRLLACPVLATQRYRIQSTLEQQQAHRREAEFKFLDLKAVADVLANQAPANVADLTYLTLNYLDDIVHELRNTNDDGYRMFWNITKAQPTGRREENLCRDVLLSRLRSRLTAHGISIAPEYDHAGDKRADLYLDYRNQLALPIEIKRDDHANLWTALRDQLITQYVDAPKSEGHGIYLVLWFGDSKKLKNPPNRQPKPTTPAELKTKLEAQLTSEEQQRVFVRVLDVSWPT